jgi:hypothetical protein
VKVTETWRYISRRFAKYRHDPGVLCSILDDDNAAGERLGKRRIGNEFWQRFRLQREYRRWGMGVCYLFSARTRAKKDTQRQGQ